MRILPFIIVAALVSGCTGMMQAMSKDPVRVTNIGPKKRDKDPVVSIASFDATRRNMVVVLEGKNKGKFCAEPAADVALNVKSETSAKGTGESVMEPGTVTITGEAVSKYEDTITVLAQRTVLLDIYRTATYSLCQYYLNGAINESDLAAQFTDMTSSVLDAYKNKK